MKNTIETNSNNKIKDYDDKLPTFPDTLFPQLPKFLQDAVLHANSNQERDMLLLGALTTISSGLPTIYGTYDDNKVFTNLYLFVTAPPSSGKGKLKKTRLLINPIHKLHRDQNVSSKNNYKKDIADYNRNKSKNKDLVKPIRPPEKMLFIPANNSSTGMLQLLYDNGGRGIIFETEGDTLTQAFKSDYSNYSDGFRKAYHHEPISYYRRTEFEYVEIENPKLSVVLSGTPGQVTSLIPDAENGLFSRFMFYYLDLKSDWINPYTNSKTNELDLKYNDLGNQFFDFYNLLNDNTEIKINLSESQSAKSFKFFSKIQAKYENIESEQFIANIRRMGLTSFRLMMILTALRIMEDGDISQEIECSDIDFDNVLEMIQILILHTRKVFFTLAPAKRTSGFKSLKEEFIDALPKEFSREDYLTIAEIIGINNKTAEGYITALVKDKIIGRKSQNNYINTLIPDEKETKEIEDTNDTSATSSKPSTS